MKKIFSLILAILILVAGLVLPRTTRAISVLQGMIKYYTSNDNGPFIRSITPFPSGTNTQSNNPDGSVTVSINGAEGYADSGFVIYYGPLGNLNNFVLNGSGNEYGLNLWFDADNSGEYFNWSGSLFTGIGADKYILGPSSSGGVINITDLSQFTSLLPGGGNYTLAELKAGNASGITSGTNVAIWVGVCCGGTKSATVSLVVPQPINKEQCKNNGWKTFRDPEFKNQGDCISFIQSNPKAVSNKTK